MTQEKARPSGLVKLGFKVPVWAYRAHLGFLFGGYEIVGPGNDIATVCDFAETLRLVELDEHGRLTLAETGLCIGNLVTRGNDLALQDLRLLLAALQDPGAELTCMASPNVTYAK